MKTTTTRTRRTTTRTRWSSRSWTSIARRSSAARSSTAAATRVARAAASRAATTEAAAATSSRATRASQMLGRRGYGREAVRGTAGACRPCCVDVSSWCASERKSSRDREIERDREGSRDGWISLRNSPRNQPSTQASKLQQPRGRSRVTEQQQQQRASNEDTGALASMVSLSLCSLLPSLLSFALRPFAFLFSLKPSTSEILSARIQSPPSLSLSRLAHSRYQPPMRNLFLGLSSSLPRYSRHQHASDSVLRTALWQLSRSPISCPGKL